MAVYASCWEKLLIVFWWVEVSFLSLSLSDQQGCLRWYVLGCLRAACLLITRFVFLSCLLCFPSGSAGKESACNGGDLGLIAGLERSTGEWNGYPLQYSGLENSMDCVAHGVTKSRTWVTFTCLLFEWGFQHSMLPAVVWCQILDPGVGFHGSSHWLKLPEVRGFMVV